MGTVPQTTSNEFCAECGNLVDSLNEFTGWCQECSVASGQISPSCPNCGIETNDGKLCSRCKYSAWLYRNANSIESVMAIQNVSVRQARRIVQTNNRPICRSCQQPIKGGQRGRHNFCMKRPECIKAHNAYAYHIRYKPHEEALSLAITASIIYKLTNNISQKTQTANRDKR